jgi:hypothetical protein
MRGEGEGVGGVQLNALRRELRAADGESMSLDADHAREAVDAVAAGGAAHSPHDVAVTNAAFRAAAAKTANPFAVSF